ncbi:MAG TPA: hypothetical protein VLW85_11365 [Myxococcales bacterium]|nr:hypothetical protein [Myxococcales bacterium]
MRLLLALLLIAAAANAQGLDRDTMLTDAPAVPGQGTVRITGGFIGTTDTNGVPGSEGPVQGQVNLSGNIQWTPIQNLAGDVGAYFQVGAQGPSARVRYQFLDQSTAGIDLSGGIRFKTVGFHPDQGEVEFLVAAGRRFGHWELVLDGVFGVETGGGQGKDVEAKAFAGYRFGDALRAGVDSRLQAEVSDEENAAVSTGRDYDLTVGPTVSWLIMKNFQVQALVGMVQPKKTDLTSPLGFLSMSFDF